MGIEEKTYSLTWVEASKIILPYLTIEGIEQIEDPLYVERGESLPSEDAASLKREFAKMNINSPKEMIAFNIVQQVGCGFGGDKILNFLEVIVTTKSFENMLGGYLSYQASIYEWGKYCNFPYKFNKFKLDLDKSCKSLMDIVYNSLGNYSSLIFLQCLILTIDEKNNLHLKPIREEAKPSLENQGH